MTSSYSRLFRLRQLARMTHAVPCSQLARMTHAVPCTQHAVVPLRPMHTSAGLHEERRFGEAIGKPAFQESESDCYKEMPGKSTMTFLQDFKENFMVDSFSSRGFRINQGSAFILGKHSQVLTVLSKTLYPFLSRRGSRLLEVTVHLVDKIFHSRFE